MELKRIWPKLLIISSVILILCFIVFLKVVLTPIEGYVLGQPYKYYNIYLFLFLFSIIVSSMILVGCAQLFKDPYALLAIPLLGQFIAYGLIMPFRLWAKALPGGSEAGMDFYFTSIFFIWIGGGLLTVMLYGLFKELIPREKRKWVHTDAGTASLVLGILGLFTYFSFTALIFGPLAILSGAFAWRKDKDIYGLAGIILGIISIVGWILAV